MAVGLCHSDKKAVCRNLQYSENVNMPDSPGWKWVQTVQTETADRYLIRLKSREEGRARKTYRVEVKEDTVDAKSAPNVTPVSYTHLDVYKRQLLCAGELLQCAL